MGEICSIGLYGLLVARQPTWGRGWGGFHTARYFYDAELIEDGKTTNPVSIGAVVEGGREYYAVPTELDGSKARPQVRANVFNQLPNPSSSLWKNRGTIREELLALLTEPGTGDPELWAWVGAYDYIVLVQPWGDIIKPPQFIPRYTRELKQYWGVAGKPRLPKQTASKHDALANAQRNLLKFQEAEQKLPLS